MNPYQGLRPLECQEHLIEVEAMRQDIVKEQERLELLLAINTRHRNWLLEAMGQVHLELV